MKRKMSMREAQRAKFFANGGFEALREKRASLRREGVKTLWNNKGTLVRKKPPKKIARHRRREHEEYMAAFPAWVAQPKNARCAVCILLFAAGEQWTIFLTTERHHFRGRHHKLLCWEPGWIPCCRHHREWVHAPENRTRAEEAGLISTRAEWNVYPPELRNAA